MKSTGDISPQQIYDALKSLQEMEQRQSETVNAAVAEVMNWLAKRIESNSDILNLFGHLVPRPLPQAPEPAPAQQAWDTPFQGPTARAAPPPLPETPYPVPPPGSYDEHEAADAYQQRLMEFRRTWGTGGNG